MLSSSRSSTTSSSSSSSSSSSDRSSSREKKKKRRRREKENKPNRYFQVENKNTKWAWELLEDDLANYTNSQCRKYIPDKDIMESFLENSPVPDNIDKTLRLDTTMESFLRDKGASTTIAKDKSLTRICGKVRDVLAPLSKVWQLVEKARAGNGGEFDVDETATLLQQSVTLVGQAINAANFYRRKTVLTTLNNNENKSTHSSCLEKNSSKASRKMPGTTTEPSSKY